MNESTNVSPVWTADEPWGSGRLQDHSYSRARIRERLKGWYKAVDRRHPILGSLLRRVYYQMPLNRVRKMIKGRGNVLCYDGAVLSSVVFDIVGNGNAISIGSSCFLKSVTFHIRGDNHFILIGEACRFNRGGTIWIEDTDGSLDIGENSTFENVHLAVTEPGSRIRVGRDCMFAYDIDVRTGDSHSIFDQKSHQRVNCAENVSIGNHVWVAAHCTILKGARIPDGSVVATGAIVTKRFSQEGSVIAGNPAQVVKEGIYWSRERVYQPNRPGEPLDGAAPSLLCRRGA